MMLALASVLLVAQPAETPTPQRAAFVQSRTRDIGVGDPLRRPLLDALRPSIQRDLGQPVQFMVDRLRVQGDWAFFDGSVQQPNGRPIDFSRTRYREEIDEGFFDGPHTYALLRRSGNKWNVVSFVVGPTDVAYMGWPDEYGVPASLF